MSDTPGLATLPRARGVQTRLLARWQGRLAARALVLGIVLLAWEYLPSRPIRFWVGRPSAIVGTVADWIVDGSLWPHLGATLLAMALGYAIGVAVGVALGLFFGFVPALHKVFAPYISALYALPKIALAPVFIIVMGVGIGSKVALVAVTVAFLLLNSTLDGVQNIDRDQIRSLLLMGARRTEVIRKLLIPAALPWIFTGMRLAIRYAFTNTLLAELIGSNRGLGFLIEFYSGQFDSTGTYAAILVLVVFSVALTELVSRIERRLARAG